MTDEMTDKANEIQEIRKARLLFQMAVDMMEDYRVDADRGILEGNLYSKYVADAENSFFVWVLSERGWCPDCDVAKTKCEC